MVSYTASFRSCDFDKVVLLDTMYSQGTWFWIHWPLKNDMRRKGDYCSLKYDLFSSSFPLCQHSHHDKRTHFYDSVYHKNIPRNVFHIHTVRYANWFINTFLSKQLSWIAIKMWLLLSRKHTASPIQTSVSQWSLNKQYLFALRTKRSIYTHREGKMRDYWTLIFFPSSGYLRLSARKK